MEKMLTSWRLRSLKSHYNVLEQSRLDQWSKELDVAQTIFLLVGWFPDFPHFANCCRVVCVKCSPNVQCRDECAGVANLLTPLWTMYRLLSLQHIIFHSPVKDFTWWIIFLCSTELEGELFIRYLNKNYILKEVS